MAPPRPWGGRSSAPNFTERLWASSSVAKAVRLTTQFCDNIEGHNSYVDAALLGLKVTACTVGHLAIVTVNRLIGMDNLDRWASRMLDEIMYIADPSTRHSVECKGKVHQGSKDNEDEVIVPIREMVKAEGKHKEKILQNEHTIIHKGTSSEHKHGFAGCPEGTQENKVTEQSELSRNHCNVEEIQREDIEVATGAKGGCGSARLSGDVVEAGETHRKGCVMGGAETKGDTEKLGEKKPNTEELTLYRKFMDREENADDRVISTKNDTGIEAISENKTEKGEFTEKEFERESERVAEVTDETDVTENKDDAAVVSENKNEAEEVAEDTNKTKDMKENENETEEVMKNSNRAEQVVENKIITESKAEAEQVAATQAEAEQVAATQAEAEQVAATQAEAEQVAATQAEAEQAAGNKLDRERENNNETDDIKEHKAAFGHPEIASDFKRGGSAVDGARPGPTSAPKKSSAADGTANVGGAGRKNKKKNSRRKK